MFGGPSVRPSGNPMGGPARAHHAVRKAWGVGAKNVPGHDSWPKEDGVCPTDNDGRGWW